MGRTDLLASESFRDWLLFSFLAVQTVHPTYNKNFPQKKTNFLSKAKGTHNHSVF